VKPVEPARLAAILREAPCDGSQPVKSSPDGANP